MRTRALVPEDLIGRRNGHTAGVIGLVRAVIAKAAAKIERREDIATILRGRWPDDPIAPLVLRAASTPATLTNTAALGRSIVADLIATIGPVGAGAQLLQSGLRFVFDSAATIYVPALEASASEVSFVQESASIAVHDLVSTSVALVPRKLATIATLTAEMLASSNAEAFVTDALTRSVGLSLDTVLFDSVAASAIRPAGLRYNIAARPASTATDPHAAMIQDMVALAGAVSVIDNASCLLLLRRALLPWSCGPTLQFPSRFLPHRRWRRMI